MTVAENLLFGTPRGAVFDFATLRDNKVLAKAIEAGGLKPALIAMGEKIAETMVELFADLPPGHPFFEQFSFVSADDLRWSSNCWPACSAAASRRPRRPISSG